MNIHIHMPIQPHHVDRLKAIIKAEQGKDMTEKEAWDMARRLYHLFRLLLWGIVDGDDEQ